LQIFPARRRAQSPAAGGIALPADLPTATGNSADRDRQFRRPRPAIPPTDRPRRPAPTRQQARPTAPPDAARTGTRKQTEPGEKTKERTEDRPKANQTKTATEAAKSRDKSSEKPRPNKHAHSTAIETRDQRDSEKPAGSARPKKRALVRLPHKTRAICDHRPTETRQETAQNTKMSRFGQFDPKSNAPDWIVSPAT